MSKIDYSKIDVEDFLNQLGMHNVRRDGKEVFFSCPFEGHNHGDLNPSASMQSGTTKVHCFGCGFSGNALTFLAEYENVSPLKAARFIREYIGDEFKEPEGSFVTEIIERLSPKKKEENPKRNQPIDKKELIKRKIDWREAWKYQPNQLIRDFQYMFERGFTWDTLDTWCIGWDEISRRFTIPYFDKDGNLIGFKGRALVDEVGNGNARYKVLGGIEYGFDTFDVSLMLFGEDAIILWPGFNNDQLLVVEGELNVIALYQMGIGPAVGISGKHLSNEQAYMLSKYDRELIFYFDDINDARKAADKLLATNRVSIVPEHDKDPADSTPDEVRDLLSRTESAIISV